MEQRGDFIGFSFAGIHSSTLNIIRTSDGDRFDENLVPDVKDITAEIPGMDGEYYFGSTYGNRTFDISIAYDHMTESDIRRLRQIFGRKQIGELIFDERPYKKYMVKIESPIELSYVCFDEPKKELVDFNGIYGETQVSRAVAGKQRVYKGEGKISFIAYFPFAKSCFKVLDTDELKDSDWAVSSGILTSEAYANIDTYNTQNGTINIYNAGDVPTGFRLYIPGTVNENPSSVTIDNFSLLYTPAAGSANTSALVINSMELKDNDIGILIDTNAGLIVGVQSISYNQDMNRQIVTSGNLYNEYINSGYFFKLQPNSLVNNATLQITGGKEGIEIFYDYLYF